MMWRIFTILSACGLLVACNPIPKTDQFSYRMTLEIDTPSGIRSSSAVRRVKKTEPYFDGFFGPTAPRWTAEGEAVAIDLPNGRPLFAVLAGAPYNSSQPHQTMARLFDSRNAMLGQEIDLWTSQGGDALLNNREVLRPMLVVLVEPSDPASVVEIDPSGESDKLGHGVSIQKISVALTGEAPGFTLVERYPWISSYSNKWLNGSERKSIDLLAGTGARLRAGHFSYGGD
ncbi:MAG: hypothetical protein ABJ239_04445 [Erythrobacter sp.]